MKKFDKLIRLLLIVVVVLALIKSILIDPGNGSIPTGKIQQINAQWELVQQTEGVMQHRDYQCTIPGNSSYDLVFSLKSSWVSYKVSVDGKEIYAFSDCNQELGEQRAWIEIPEDSQGKTLELHLDGKEGLINRTMKNAMFLGEKNAVFIKSLQANSHALLFFLFSVIFVAVFFLCERELKSKLSKKNIREIRYMEAFILDAGVWVLTDSQLLQIFVERTAVISIVSFASFLLMPLLMILFIKELMAYPWEIFNMLLRVGSVNIVIILGLYVFRFLPVYKLLFLQHILILVALGVFINKGAAEIKRYKNQEMKKVMAGLGLLGACGAVALLLFYMNIPAYAYMYIVGLILFLLCLVRAVFGEIYLYMGQSAMAADYRKMAYTDMMTGMENRAAFQSALGEGNAEKGRAYIVFDTNNLKNINDHYGHQAGDLLLVETASCIRESFERIGRCFRTGGDEFVVILNDTTKKELETSLADFHRKLEGVNKWRDIPIAVACGYAICENTVTDTNALFEKADKNMYANKQAMKKGKG